MREAPGCGIAVELGNGDEADGSSDTVGVAGEEEDNEDDVGGAGDVIDGCDDGETLP